MDTIRARDIRKLGHPWPQSTGTKNNLIQNRAPTSGTLCLRPLMGHAYLRSAGCKGPSGQSRHTADHRNFACKSDLYCRFDVSSSPIILAQYLICIIASIFFSGFTWICCTVCFELEKVSAFLYRNLWVKNSSFILSVNRIWTMRWLIYLHKSNWCNLGFYYENERLILD